LSKIKKLQLHKAPPDPAQLAAAAGAGVDDEDDELLDNAIAGSGLDNPERRAIIEKKRAEAAEAMKKRGGTAGLASAADRREAGMSLTDLSSYMDRWGALLKLPMPVINAAKYVARRVHQLALSEGVPSIYVAGIIAFVCLYYTDKTKVPPFSGNR
jgi:hypothetical protein